MVLSLIVVVGPKVNGTMKVSDIGYLNAIYNYLCSVLLADGDKVTLYNNVWLIVDLIVQSQSHDMLGSSLASLLVPGIRRNLHILLVFLPLTSLSGYCHNLGSCLGV
jgi:hypothetical protein